MGHPRPRYLQNMTLYHLMVTEGHRSQWKKAIIE